MNMIFEEVTKGIFRLRVPFERLYTSVFLIESADGAYLVDCATTDFDVDEIIRPALKARGLDFDTLKALILTHRHGDHAGGLSKIKELAPNLTVLSGGEARALDQNLSIYPLAGHTEDSIGVYDARTRTLIAGDGLQGEGVDRYPCYTQNREAYLLTIEKIKNDQAIENILFSHAYEPWRTDVAIGRRSVLLCIEASRKYIEEREKNK